MKNHEVFFTIPLRPISAGRPRVFRGHAGYSKTYQRFSRQVNLWLEQNDQLYQALKYRLSSCNIFSVTITSIFKTKNENLWDLPHISKPDLDNLLKAQIDRIIYAIMPDDDAHINKIVSEKVYGPEDKIKVKISGRFIDIDKKKKQYKRKYPKTYRKSKNNKKPHTGQKNGLFDTELSYEELKELKEKF